MELYKTQFLRKTFLPVLRAFSFDFWMHHPYVKKRRFFLNSFNHKGYWYHGRNRERQSMELFKILIPSGATVVEVGGHIGFISQYFIDIVGEKGKVYIFEPGSNNLPYLKDNINEMNGCCAGNIFLIESAVSDKHGTVDFYEDNITGQNNSVVKDFDGLKQNEAFAHMRAAVNKRTVSAVTLDEFFRDEAVDFIKIDIEGYEWYALQGAKNVIAHNNPIIMVEIQASYSEIFSFFVEQDYLLFNEQREVITNYNNLRANTFCLHKKKHEEQISRLKFGTSL